MTNNNYTELQKSTYLSGNSADYVEALYEAYLKAPHSVSEEWSRYFSSLDQSKQDVSHADIRDYFEYIAHAPKSGVQLSGDAERVLKQSHVSHLITSFRTHGHLSANFNPLKTGDFSAHQLHLDAHGLSSQDLEQVFAAPALMGEGEFTLREIESALKETYCRSIGFEFMHIRNQEEVNWLQHRVERVRAKPSFEKEKKLGILHWVTAADGLEKYLGSKYVGQKRFSLEGGDSLIPIMHYMNQRAGELGVKEISIGMAHRGRLNVLVNIMGKSPKALFEEFEGTKKYGLTSGDVKYHMGFSSDIETKGGPVHLTLAFNPSHLEVISPVVMGSVRARQTRYENDRNKVVPVIVHGDAAVAGQGIVMETLNMSQTRAYHVGGAVHLVINNQVGFTTSNPHDARSSLYCTDVAKMTDAPILHVNGDDPEACVFAAELAMDYRMQFNKDIFIDLVCYRRHGHNEADEPAATQPLMYKDIKVHKAPRHVYAAQLEAEGVCDLAEAEANYTDNQTKLERGENIVPLLNGGLSEKYTIHWTPYLEKEWTEKADTTFDKATLFDLAKQISTLPEGFTPQRQVGLIVKARQKMAAGEQPLDWGFAENLAYATLLSHGTSVRMSGQDCRRGTFAHRHAVFHDFNNDNLYTPLDHVKQNAAFEVYDSLLSEYAVMGFEYGYAKTDPHNLVIWEAQFGDFANGAQVIIDQFISSAWQKWQRLSGLVLLLPHGYEGMGPEHSSARLERFLQLCAQRNIQVCVPTTPAQIYHLLRRQVIRQYRRPLIVMSPKSLLRHKLAVSSMEELAEGQFQVMIPEVDDIDPKNVRRVVICSGKVYYDLLAKRRELGVSDIALIRIEQLYPFDYGMMQKMLAQYATVTDVVWCQEEPKNQGGWFITQPRLIDCLGEGQILRYVGRAPSASPAVGYSALHIKQQNEIIDTIFSKGDN